MGWINKLDKYFHVKGITDEERIPRQTIVIVVAFEVQMLGWLVILVGILNPNPSWQGSKSTVIWRFQLSMIQNPSILEQIHSIDKFIVKFESIIV